MALMSSGNGLNGNQLRLATAAIEHVLNGKTFYSGTKEMKTGIMANHGSWSASVEAGNSVIIPKGYHDGNGKVSGTYSKGLVVTKGASITAPIDGWYVAIGICTKFGGNYNPDYTYSTNGSNVTVISDRSEGNADGGYGDICVKAYLKKGQNLSIRVTNGSGTYRSEFIIYQG